jgi:hypothetical protein
MSDDLCGCMKCHDARHRASGSPFASMETGWRYACEICGNKRCPHHTDHNLACTNSNEPGQPGSAFT